MTDQRLEGKAALITGAGQGIGRGIATVFADVGAKVVVATRTAVSGQVTVDAINEAGGDAILVETDVQDPEQCQAAVDATVDAFGRLDIMVHNAASFAGGMIEHFDPADLQDALSTNLIAGFHLTKMSIPHMKARGAGRLLFTSSVTGPRVVMPGAGYYAATKSGLNGFIRTAGMELAPLKITVNGVEPGFIKTPALDHIADAAGQAEMAKYVPAGHFGEPEDIAHAMVYLASDQASYVTGQTICVDGGSTLPESPLFYEESADGVSALGEP